MHRLQNTLIPRWVPDGPGAVPLAFAGAASGLALPPVGAWWVLFFTVPLLLWRLEASLDWRTAFRAGLGFGLGYFCVAFQWIGFAFLVHAADIWMMPFAVGGLAFFTALYWAIAVAAAALVPSRIVPRWLAALLLLAVTEYLRGRLFTGFPWAVPGLAADAMGGVVQLASVFGMNGLTALVMVWAALPVLLWQSRRQGVRAIWLPALVLMTLPVSCLWGEWRLSQTPIVFDDTVVVRLVQPNIAQDDKWRSDNASEIFGTLLRLSGDGPGAAAVTHVIWPESSVPFLLDEDGTALRRIADQLVPGQTLLAGSIRRDARPVDCTTCDAPYFTSILMVDEQGVVTGHYDKWRLVPGGEYLPFEGLLSRLGFRKIVSLPESFTPGQGAGVLVVPGLGLAGMLVCYEVIFPHQLLPAMRPKVLVNVTNDGWFGRSSGPYQHFAQARLRSIEQGLPLLRAANTGISAVIDPLGRIVIQSMLNHSTFLDSKVPQAIDAPLYAKWGDLMLFVVLALLAVFLRTTRWRARQFA